MPEYLAPGVYVEEIASGSRPIEGVSTSTSGIVGVTQRGPVGVATLVTSFPDFVRQFGGYLDDRVYTNSAWYLPHAVEGFFTNGGRRIYVVRVLPNSATSAGITLFDWGSLDMADGITFNGFENILAVQAMEDSQIIAIQDETSITDSGWLLVQDQQSSEYVQLAPDPAGVVALASPLVSFWPAGTAVVDADDTDHSTTLTVAANAGDFLLVVEDVNAIAGANSYTIGAVPATPEMISATAAIGLTAGLNFSHPVETGVFEPTFSTGPAPSLAEAAAAGATEITLDDRTEIDSSPPAGSFLLLTDVDMNSEIVYIESVEEPRTAAPDRGIVRLRYPLAGSYNVGDSAELHQDNDTDVGASTTALTAGSTTFDRAIWVGNSTGFTPGNFVRIEAINSPSVEYHLVADNPPDLRVVQSPLRASHTGGTAIAARSPALRIEAVDRGVWGNQLRVIARAETNPLLRETTPETFPGLGNPTLSLRTTLGIHSGSILEFFTRSPLGEETILFRQKVDNVEGNDVTFTGGVLQAVNADVRIRTVEFQLVVQLVRVNPRTQREEIVEDEFFRQLSLDPRHPNYVVRRIGSIYVNNTDTPLQENGRTEGESNLIRVSDLLTPANAETILRPSPDILLNGQGRPFGILFEGGHDDIPSLSPAVYIGEEGTDPPTSRTGIFALKNEEDIAIVGVPGQTDQTVQEALLNHCELMRYRFAVLDSEVGSSLAAVQNQRSLYDSRYGAFYYPWLRIVDPFPENPRIPSFVSLPSSGHIMGIYARTDIDRGVHKAPANEVIRGISDLEIKLTKEEQDVLNPNHVNVLRNFRDNNRGLRVWGARTLSSDPLWRYVNVRRLFIFIENSIDRGTQWAVFEPNDEITWARLRRTATAFLTRVWRDGALQGVTQSEAFFVRCDRTTMTQDDIDNGRLIMLIGIAPVKPAEFVIIRIGQKIGGSEVEELG
jgi:phage tail sheath protein FI